MKISSLLRRSVWLALCVAALQLAATGMRADDVRDQNPPHETWDLAVIPYVWAAGIEANAQANIAGQDVDVDVDQSSLDILQDLELGAMGVIDARYRRVVGLFDGAYAKVGDESDVLNGRLDADF